MHYFIDEYAAGDEKDIDFKRFEEDYEEIIAGPNALIEKIVETFITEMHRYCLKKDKSIVDALAEA